MQNNIIQFLNKFDALIFDFDGTLVDSMPAHNQAWIETLRRYDIDVTSDALQSLAGKPNLDTARMFIEKYQAPANPNEIAQLKEKRAIELLSNSQAFPELVEIVHQFFTKVPLAIVSGSERKVLMNQLERLKLQEFFSIIICHEDCAKGKPHPDPFLLAAKKIRVSAKNCLVFEDGDLGIQAALAAQMTTIKVIHGKCQWSGFNGLT